LDIERLLLGLLILPTSVLVLFDVTFDSDPSNPKTASSVPRSRLVRLVRNPAMHAAGCIIARPTKTWQLASTLDAS
jgi:hypothetical protein